jgi:hypothetical protein
MQEITPVSLSTITEIVDEIPETILEMEILMTLRLQWNLSPPTALTWLHIFMDKFKEDGVKLPASAMVDVSQLIQYFYIDRRSLGVCAGKIAAACLQVYTRIGVEIYYLFYPAKLLQDTLILK